LKPSHPFLTSELDERRARQRRIFRLIPDWIIEKAETDSTPGPLDTPDRALIERSSAVWRMRTSPTSRPILRTGRGTGGYPW
jgi:hypothetical protein